MKCVRFDWARSDELDLRQSWQINPINEVPNKWQNFSASSSHIPWALWGPTPFLTSAAIESKILPNTDFWNSHITRNKNKNLVNAITWESSQNISNLFLYLGASLGAFPISSNKVIYPKQTNRRDFANAWRQATPHADRGMTQSERALCVRSLTRSNEWLDRGVNTSRSTRRNSNC